MKERGIRNKVSFYDIEDHLQFVGDLKGSQALGVPIEEVKRYLLAIEFTETIDIKLEEDIHNALFFWIDNLYEERNRTAAL